MPFEIPQKTEQEQRVQLGRIALEAIAAHILTVPNKQWYIGMWRTQRGECGTVGCAIGHSYELPEVIATGLRPGPDFYPVVDGGPLPATCGYGAFRVIGAAFAIPVEVAESFFWSLRFRGSGPDTTQQQVAARIREYLAA